MFANHHTCVVLQSSIRHIGGWNSPKVMHKFKYTLLLVNDFARIAQEKAFKDSKRETIYKL